MKHVTEMKERERKKDKVDHNDRSKTQERKERVEHITETKLRESKNDGAYYDRNEIKYRLHWSLANKVSGAIHTG